MSKVYFILALVLCLSLRAEEPHNHDKEDSHAPEKQHADKKSEPVHGHKHDDEAKHEDGEENHDHGAEEGHSHDEEAGHDHGEEGHEHGEEEEHEHDGEHEEEESAGVGPDKGILEKGKLGFKLSLEAMQTFALKTQKISSPKAYPREAIVKIKDGKFAYRLKDGWIKRITLEELVAGDELIVVGTGFVRTAELVAVEGVAHGHSH